MIDPEIYEDSSAFWFEQHIFEAPNNALPPIYFRNSFNKTKSNKFYFTIQFNSFLKKKERFNQFQKYKIKVKEEIPGKRL